MVKEGCTKECEIGEIFPNETFHIGAMLILQLLLLEYVYSEKRIIH